MFPLCSPCVPVLLVVSFYKSIKEILKHIIPNVNDRKNKKVVRNDTLMISSGDFKIDQKKYKELVRQVKPKPTVIKNSILAFGVGGLICTLGQLIMNYFNQLGLSVQDAGLATSAVLVFLAALLTGLGVYDEIAKYAGAGTIVPITGFANSMVAPAMEYRGEGMIFGTGARLFTIAGPVLVFGIVSSWLAGLISYIFSI